MSTDFADLDPAAADPRRFHNRLSDREIKQMTPILDLQIRLKRPPALNRLLLADLTDLTDIIAVFIIILWVVLVILLQTQRLILLILNKDAIILDVQACRDLVLLLI